MGQVEGKIALVTGGASGIGAACAATLAREGAKVVVTDIDDKLGKQTVERIQSAGGDAVFLNQDVTQEQRWAEIVAEIERRHRGLNILVSNAGIGVGAPSIVDMTLADWRRQTAINLDGVFLSVKYCLPLMRRSGPGSIVMMSSVAGLRGSPFLAGYCATKGGVRLFAKSIAMECAQVGDGIRVNSVHPGIIDTPIWGKIPNGGANQAGHNSPMRAEELGKAGAPLGRAGQAQEIADGVLFLASDASRYITGTELIIDGGMTAGSVRRAAEQQQQ
jgi:NAD(P)-dependent dehydrogenase (short-subunit alcohol dehydrogenase family)